MVLTASTQWSIPLMGSSMNNVTSVAKPAPSVLGLKTCQVSSAMPSQQDVITSRRQAIDIRNRSAGSFHSFQAALKREGVSWPKDDCEEDGMYWSPSAISNLIDADGDITAADVDLLPMPGLVSYPSPYYESQFSFSPTDSAMTRISSSESISSASSSKYAMMPNFLGLPPNFHQDIYGLDVKGSMCDESAKSFVGSTTTSLAEDQINTSNHLLAKSFGETLPQFMKNANVEEDDNFADCLEGFWNQHAINCEPEMLQGTESLDSILTGLPQKFITAASGGVRFPSQSEVAEDCIGTGFIMDELEYLVNAPNEVSEEVRFQSASGNESLNAVVHNTGFELQSCNGGISNEWKSEAGPVTPNGSQSASQTSSILLQGSEPAEKYWSSSQGSGSSVRSNAAVPKSPASSSDLQVEATSQEANFVNSGDFQPTESFYSSSLPVKLESNCTKDGNFNITGKKRSFSCMAEVPGCTASAPAAGGTDVSPDMQPNMSYTSTTQAFSAMLYKSQGGQARHLITEADLKPPPAKVRRRHGTATDPQSIAARTRREKFSDRIRVLQSLVPNGERLDTVSMLGQTLEYVRFLQHQVWQLYHGMDPSAPSSVKSEKWKDFLEIQPVAAG